MSAHLQFSLRDSFHAAELSDIKFSNQSHGKGGELSDEARG
jgi:hypothetical protein